MPVYLYILNFDTTCICASILAVIVKTDLNKRIISEICCTPGKPQTINATIKQPKYATRELNTNNNPQNQPTNQILTSQNCHRPSAAGPPLCRRRPNGRRSHANHRTGIS